MPIKSTDAEFIEAWRRTGGRAVEVAKMLGMTSTRGVYGRRNRIEETRGVQLPSAGDGRGQHRGDAGQAAYSYNPRLKIDGFTGTLVSFSDCHWWPGLSETVAFKALLEVIKEIKPELVIGNGDLLDGARISRFGRSDWSQTPTVDAELEEVKARCSDIRTVHRRARHIRTIGNHDQRFDKLLANKVSEFEDVAGFRLADHLKEWEETMSIWINGGSVVVKHRWHGGVHTAWQNVMKGGVTMLTGHTHVLESKPFSDYRGIRWGIQDGTLADTYGPQFAYGEDNPTQACPGFAVLTFDKSGRLIDPEICRVIDGVAWFRGQVVVSVRKKARAA